MDWILDIYIMIIHPHTGNQHISHPETDQSHKQGSMDSCAVSKIIIARTPPHNLHEGQTTPASL